MSLLLERELIIITSSSISIFFCLFKFELLTKSVHRIFLFHFLFFQQVTAAASIDMIPRHSFSRCLTSQDWHLWNFLRIEITVMPYTTARLMDLLLEEAMIFTLPTTRHPIAIPTLPLVTLTAHQVGTAMEAPPPTLFWQALLLLLQTKWKHFTKQPKNCGIVYSFKLDSQLILHWLSQGNIFFY